MKSLHTKKVSQQYASAIKEIINSTLPNKNNAINDKGNTFTKKKQHSTKLLQPKNDPQILTDTKNKTVMSKDKKEVLRVVYHGK